MYMPVLELIGGRFADIDDLHVEMKGLSGERVVCIERDILAIDLDYRDDLDTVLSMRLELHTRCDLDVFAEVLFLNFEYEGFVSVAVGIFWCDAAHDRVARILAFELFFEPRNNIFIPMKVHERLGSFG